MEFNILQEVYTEAAPDERLQRSAGAGLGGGGGGGDVAAGARRAAMGRRAGVGSRRAEIRGGMDGEEAEIGEHAHRAVINRTVSSRR